MTNISELILKAREILHYKKLTDECVVGDVSAALITVDGNVYSGVSISAACGIGFCAEHSAIAQMLTNGESQIVRIVAVSGDGILLPPCGRCRELIFQINHLNLQSEIVVDENKVIKLKDLLPQRWQDVF